MPPILRRALVVLILVFAVLQWKLILERGCAAFWAWYMFYGYGGGGYLDVNGKLQIVFLLGSGLLALFGRALARSEAAFGDSVVWKRLATAGWLLLAGGGLIWLAVVMSPVVEFRR
jgi:hypothetical protein